MTARHQLEQRTLPAMLAANAEGASDDVFLNDERGSLTWGGAWEMARAHSAAFTALGIGRGDTVVLMLDNRREMLASWFGLGSMGAVEVPTNPGSGAARLTHVINHSGAATVVVQAEQVDLLEAIVPDLPALKRAIVVGGATVSGLDCVPFDELQIDGQPPSHDAVALSDPVAIMYTSGSTGPAKGAVLPHGQHYMNGWQGASRAALTPEDVLFLCLPLHHNMAQGYGVWPAIVSRSAVNLTPGFDRRTFWERVSQSRATVFPFVGAMIALLAADAHDTGAHDLRLGFGVPLPGDLHQRFEANFGINLLHCYGSTEATIPVWGSIGKDRVHGAAGKVLDEFDVELHDEHDQPVAAGVEGEICIRAHEPHSMFLKYHDDPERTAVAMRNQWFHSGDDGRFDTTGNLWFVRRTGDVIRRFGEFISAPEVEAVLAAHPDVELVAVFGVASGLIDEDVMASVVLRPESSAGADALRSWCQDRLPPFAIPRYIKLEATLPMTATGKIEKYKLKALGAIPGTDDARRRKRSRT